MRFHLVFLMTIFLLAFSDASYLINAQTNSTVFIKTVLQIRGPPLTPFTTYVAPVSLAADGSGLDTCSPLVPPFPLTTFNGSAVFLEGYGGW